MTEGPNPASRESSFEQMEKVKRDERRRRYRETTPGERVEEALRMSALAAELRAALRRGDG